MWGKEYSPQVTAMFIVLSFPFFFFSSERGYPVVIACHGLYDLRTIQHMGRSVEAMEVGE